MEAMGVDETKRVFWISRRLVALYISHSFRLNPLGELISIPKLSSAYTIVAQC